MHVHIKAWCAVMARKIATATLIALLALIIRCAVTLTWFNQRERIFAPDSYGYERLAINLIEHGAFSQSAIPPLVPDTHRTPLYPLFILAVYRAVGEYPTAVVISQDIIDTISTILIYAIASSASTHAAGVLASIAYAIAPLPIFQCQRMLSETLFVFLTLAAVLAGLKALARFRTGAIAACGLLLGLATLTRPIGIGIWLIWLVALAVAARRLAFSTWLQAMGKFALSFLLPIAPWLIRNFIAFKMLFLCTGHHLAFAYYNAAAVLSRAKGISLEQAQVQLFNQSINDFKGMRPFKAERANDIWQPAVQDPRNVAALVRHARDVIKRYPIEAISVHTEGFAQYMFMTLPIRDVLAKFAGSEEHSKPIRERMMKLLRDGKVGAAISTAWNERLHQLPLAAKLLWLYSLLFALLVEGVALSSVKVCIRRGNAVRTVCLLCMSMALYLLLSPGPQLEPRFRAIAEPWLIILASIGISNIAEGKRKGAMQQSAISR